LARREEAQPHLLDQLLVTRLPRRRLGALEPARPGVVAAAADRQRLARRALGPLVLLPLDEREAHGWGCSRAKKAVAFFKICFSVSSCRTRCSNYLMRTRRAQGSSPSAASRCRARRPNFPFSVSQPPPALPPM